MPSYNYRCPICNVEKTISHPLEDTTDHKCDNCKVSLIKVYSAPGLAFKGGGWAHKE